MVIAAGAAGALVSVLQRIHNVADDTFTGLQSLNLWRIVAGFCFAFATGAAFALVLYMFFAGELLQGALFPKIVTPALNPDSPKWLGLDYFLAYTGPNSPPDAGKLFVWSFIAGFFEKFVPGQLFLLTAGIDKKTSSVKHPLGRKTPTLHENDLD